MTMTNGARDFFVSRRTRVKETFEGPKNHEEVHRHTKVYFDKLLVMLVPVKILAAVQNLIKRTGLFII